LQDGKRTLECGNKSRRKTAYCRFPLGAERPLVCVFNLSLMRRKVAWGGGTNAIVEK
jgi:hypothetical protein